MPAEILLVDDDRDVRDTVGNVLESAGYACATAADGREAFALLDGAPPPKLILLDLRMPRMDGWQFLAERARSPRWSAIPVVVMSGVRAASFPTGVAGVLRMPVSLDELLTTVRRHLV